MAIPILRIHEIVREGDPNRNPNLGGLSFYASYMKIVLENEGVDLKKWDDEYTEKMRRVACQRTDELITQAMQSYKE